MTHAGYVDHHAHFLTQAAQYRWPDERRWFPELVERGSNPMDEPWPERCADVALPMALRSALQQVADLGIVQFTEAGIPDLSTYEALCGLREDGPLPASVRILLASGLAESLGVEAMRSLQTNDDDLDVIGVKFYSDGWLSLGNCAMDQPFEGGADRGLLFLDADTLARRAAPFAEAGFRLATHAIGDRAINQVLDAYESIFGRDCRDQAPRIEHAEVLDLDIAQRMGEMGVVVCLQPSFAPMFGNIARSLLGEKRAAHAYDWRMLLDKGVRLLVGSDAPVADPSPQVGLQNLLMHSGLTPEEAMDLMTTPA